MTGVQTCALPILHAISPEGMPRQEEREADPGVIDVDAEENNPKSKELER